MMSNSFYHSQVRRVLQSPLIARAVIRSRTNLGPGTPAAAYEMVCVFAESSQRQFFWVLKADSPNAAPADGRVIYSRDRRGHTYHDFRSFVDGHIKGMPGRSLFKMEIYDASRLERMLKAHDLCVDVFALDDSKANQSVERVNQIFRSKLAGANR